MTQLQSFTNLTITDLKGVKVSESRSIERKVNTGTVNYQSVELYSGNGAVLDLCLYSDHESTLNLTTVNATPTDDVFNHQDRYTSYSSMNIHAVTNVKVSEIKSVEIELKTPEGDNAVVYYCSLGVLSADQALVEVILFAEEKATLELLQVPETKTNLF